jgi:hypothetical protein
MTDQPEVAGQDAIREGPLDVVVVGGGQAGLAMAWHLRRQVTTGPPRPRSRRRNRMCPSTDRRRRIITVERAIFPTEGPACCGAGR